MAAVVVMQQACLLGEGVVGVDLRLCCSQKGWGVAPALLLRRGGGGGGGGGDFLRALLVPGGGGGSGGGRGGGS